MRIHPRQTSRFIVDSNGNVLDRGEDIFRVSRRKPGLNPLNNQGYGWEYIDEAGNWHHTSKLKPGKPNNPNPDFDPVAAEKTHIFKPINCP